MDILMETLRASFARQGYLQIPFDAPRATMQTAIDATFAFFALPLEEKQRWGFCKKVNEGDEHDRGTDLGYHFRRSEMGSGYDDKEYLHYNREARRVLLEGVNPPPELVAMFAAVDVVFEAVRASLQPVANLLNAHYAQPLIDIDCPFSALRILKYDQANPGAFLASGHYDRDTISLAIAESGPGLRIGINPERLKEVRHEEKRAILFPGLILEDKTHRDVHAAWHDVIQKSEDSYAPNVARWAIVFFACPNAASPYWNKELTRTKRT